MRVYLCAAAERRASPLTQRYVHCACFISPPSEHKDESSAQESRIKDHLLVGREPLQLEAERCSERPELFAGGRCGGTRLFILFTS